MSAYGHVWLLSIEENFLVFFLVYFWEGLKGAGWEGSFGYR